MKKIFLTILLCSLSACAQSGPDTVNVLVFNGATTPQVSNPVPNIGQSAHQAEICTLASSPSTFDVQLQARATSSAPWAAIAPDAYAPLFYTSTSNTACTFIQGSGYFADVRLQILSISGGSGISVWYTGSKGPLPIPFQIVPTMSGIEGASFSGTGAYQLSTENGVVNPAANQLLFAVGTITGSNAGIHFSKAFFSCTAACTIGVFQTTSKGSGCTTNTTFVKTLVPNAVVQIGTNLTDGPCTTNPSINLTTPMLLLSCPAACGTQQVDLSGVFLGQTPGNLTTFGYGFFNQTAITGTVNLAVNLYTR